MSIAHPREFARRRGSSALSGIETVSEPTRSGSFATRRLGAKAERLARLVAAGAMVPPFFVIDAQWLSRIVEEGGRERVASLPLPAELELEIARGLASLGDGPFAVRSSRVGEERPASPGASRLFRRTRREVEEAVRACWLSALEERARGLPEVAVVVQVMIDGQVSGVCATADAASGRRDRILLGAFGLGEGHGTRDELELDHEGRELATRIADKKRALTRGEASAIARECARLAAELGQPQEVSWTVRKGTLYVLNSRPIANLKTPLNTDGPRLVFERGNLDGGVVTPLGYSLLVRSHGRAYAKALGMLGVSGAELAGAPLTNLLGLVRGRVHYNLNAWRQLLALIPSQERGRELANTLGLAEPLALDTERRPGFRATLRRIAARLRTWRTLRAVERDAAAWITHCEAVSDHIASEAEAATSYSQRMDLLERAERELVGAMELPIVHALGAPAGDANQARMQACRARVLELMQELVGGVGQRLFEAGKLEHPGDVFYLTLEELEAYHEGRAVSAELLPIAAARKTEFEAYETLELPVRFETLGPVYHGNVLD